MTLAVGANVIKAVVTAEDTTTMKTYMVTVTRETTTTSDDATLRALALSGVTLARPSHRPRRITPQRWGTPSRRPR